MSIAPAILKHYPELVCSQREVVGHLDGPLLVIAGPGSGKTFSIVLRALNLLLLDKAEPKEIVLCTFTEKAAFEMRDRLAAAARKVEYARDLSELTVATIHGFCHQVLAQHRHRTELGHNYETLDELTQLLFIFEHFDDIIGPPDNDLFLTHWRTRWTAIEGARGYFDKITEELVDPCRLTASQDPFFAPQSDGTSRLLLSPLELLEELVALVPLVSQVDPDTGRICVSRNHTALGALSKGLQTIFRSQPSAAIQKALEIIRKRFAQKDKIEGHRKGGKNSGRRRRALVRDAEAVLACVS